MKRAVKWISIIVGGLIVLIIVALLVAPLFVDVEDYKPTIEKRVSEAIGRPFAINGELRLSLFPWAGLALSDLHVGNPPGFKEKDFVFIKAFDVQVKLIPLLSKDIQVQRFVMEEPRIVLERDKAGRASWEGLGKPSDKSASGISQPKSPPPEAEPQKTLPLEGLAVGEFTIKKGSLLWIDGVTGQRKELTHVNLRLDDVSLDRPIRFALSAKLEGEPLSLKGTVGPVGKKPGQGTLPVDLELKAMKEFDMGLKGQVVDPATRARYNLTVRVPPFSPRKLLKALGQPLPVATADPAVLTQMSFDAQVKGDRSSASISEGLLKLDQSKITFSGSAKDFERPDVSFKLHLDRLDLDRYLPPQAEKKAGGKEPEKKKSAPTKGTDYSALRRLVLDGTVKMDELKVHGAKIQDIHLKFQGRGGRFHLDPLSLRLYQGKLGAKGVFDLKQDTPKSHVQLLAHGIQAGPLLKDMLDKDFLEGTVNVQASIKMAGDDPDKIKRTLNGKGALRFTDGAFVGFDLGGMVRNIKAKFRLAKEAQERPRTSFSEFHAPFTIMNGVVTTPQASLKSPLIRVTASGQANLVDETLQFRVEPKFVATLKGQGDTTERTGIMVPVLVSGPFSSPKFRPDLKGMLKKVVPDPSKLKKLLEKPAGSKEEKNVLEEKAKGLLKMLPFGRKSQ